MAISGRLLRSLVSRAARRYHHSGLWLPGTRANPKTDSQAAEAPEADILDATNGADQVASHDPQEVWMATTPSRLEDGPQDRMEGEVADGPSVSPSMQISEPSSGPEGDSNEEPLAEAQEATGKNATPSLAEILANPLPPALSVDNLISETLGNIFQKKANKDPSILALLDGREEIGMRDLADELREFAVAIGATKS